MNDLRPSHLDFQATAKQIMLEHGFEPDFPLQVSQQLAELKAHPPQIASSNNVRDLRNLLWSSIDNDTSRDLDQIEVAERLANGDVKVLIGIADVDALVLRGSPIDDHAAKETTTVYTGVQNFPMLPEELSTGITSLLENQDRLGVVIEFVARKDGCVNSSNVYRAILRNKAQLTYNTVGAWLEGTGAALPKVAASADLQLQLKLQDEAAQALKNQRYQHGALNIETSEVHPVVLNQQVVDIVKQKKNRATELIEDFMIAANEVVARALEKVSSLRRIVKTPERWDRIVQVAAAHGETLPAQPDSKALNDFLLKRKAADPDHFAASVAGRHQADRTRRICFGASRRSGAGALRPGGPGLHSFHRSEPALRGCRHTKIDQSLAFRSTGSVFRGRTGSHREKLHAERRRGAEG